MQYQPALSMQSPRRTPHRLPPYRRAMPDPLLGNSSTVEQRTLTPSILVRIQVPQPNSPEPISVQQLPSIAVKLDTYSHNTPRETSRRHSARRANHFWQLGRSAAHNILVATTCSVVETAAAGPRPVATPHIATPASPRRSADGTALVLKYRPLSSNLKLERSYVVSALVRDLIATKQISCLPKQSQQYLRGRVLLVLQGNFDNRMGMVVAAPLIAQVHSLGYHVGRQIQPTFTP